MAASGDGNRRGSASRAPHGVRVTSVEELRRAAARATEGASPPRHAPTAAAETVAPQAPDPYGHLADKAAAVPTSTPDAATAVAEPVIPDIRPRPQAELLPPRLFDPRETEDWFQRLPPERQAEVRAHWQWDAERGARYVTARRRGNRRAAVDAGLILAAGWTLASIWSAGSFGAFLVSLVIAFGIGAAVGSFVHWRCAGRFTAAGLGILAYLATAMLCGLAGAAVGSGIGGMMFLLGMWLVANLFAVWGQSREFSGHQDV